MNQKSLLKKNNIKKIYFSLLLVGIGFFLLFFPRVTLPLGIAYILSLILKPFVTLFETSSWQKKIVIFSVTLLFLSFITYFFIYALDIITNETSNFELYLPKLEIYFREKYIELQNFLLTKFKYKLDFDGVELIINYGRLYLKEIIISFPKIFSTIFEYSFIIPIFLFFILKDGRSFRKLFLKIVPNPWVEKFYYLTYQFNSKFGDYILSKFVEATIVGVIITFGLLIINYPFALLLGLLAAVTNIFPYIGPVLGFIPALVIGLVDNNPETTLQGMVLLYIIANAIDLAIVFPLLVSKIVNLHPVMVIISVIIGSQIGGVIGMLISIPLAAFLKLLFLEVYRELYNQNGNNEV